MTQGGLLTGMKSLRRSRVWEEPGVDHREGTQAGGGRERDLKKEAK